MVRTVSESASLMVRVRAAAVQQHRGRDVSFQRQQRWGKSANLNASALRRRGLSSLLNSHRSGSSPERLSCPSPMTSRFVLGWLCLGLALPAGADDRVAMQAMISRHAQANGVPETLVHRIVQRESGYNPRATSPGYFGLMQIRYDTARAMGFIGRPNELLDADTNLPQVELSARQ